MSIKVGITASTIFSNILRYALSITKLTIMPCCFQIKIKDKNKLLIISFVCVRGHKISKMIDHLKYLLFSYLTRLKNRIQCSPSIYWILRWTSRLYCAITSYQIPLDNPSELFSTEYCLLCVATNDLYPQSRSELNPWPILLSQFVSTLFLCLASL